jgi:glyoxylate reductase
MDRLAADCAVTVWAKDAVMPRDELERDASGKAGLITLLTDRVDDELLDAAGEQLRVVANYAVGFDNLDLAACTRHGVLATNTPDVLTEATADMTWALLLAAARRVAEGDRFLRTRTPWVWGPEMLLGQDVHGKVLGVVGFGRIGRAVAHRAGGFGMRVVYHDPMVTDARDGEAMELDELLSEADFVAIHTNLSPATRHLINGLAALGGRRPPNLLNPDAWRAA